eukprot:6192756-Pleurochrysis_carterae.AAC.2
MATITCGGQLRTFPTPASRSRRPTCRWIPPQVRASPDERARWLRRAAPLARPALISAAYLQRLLLAMHTLFAPSKLLFF